MNKNKETLVCCSVCGSRHYPSNMNGIYGGRHDGYYCHGKECQERFIENAGDPPDDEEVNV